MPLVAVILGLAAVVWGAAYARRGSLLVGSGLVIAVGYVLGHQFWNIDVGPLPVTLDRVMLAGLLAGLVVQWRIGRLGVRPLAMGDFVLGLLLLVVISSAVFSGSAEFEPNGTSKWGRLLTSFLIPAALYLVVRQIRISPREWAVLLISFVVLGLYLAATGALEVAGKWAFVFPRYIADPTLGTHFGRARGPELNSVSLGLYLTAAFWCAWTLLAHATKRWQQLALFLTLPVLAGGVFLTYTRSTWLGMVACGLVVAAIEIPRRWRLPALGAASFVGVLLVAASWSHLTGLEREGSAAESAHSIDQRASFAYVSWQMFCDYPVFGVGFGRFYDCKLPYLSDRSQDIELESIRPLQHHNTFLSALTETGLIGLTALVAVIVVWVRCGWSLVKRNHPSSWAHSQGVLTLALLMNYFCSALFHDLTLIPSQQLLLFAFAGIAINLRQQPSGAAASRMPMPVQRFAWQRPSLRLPARRARKAAVGSGAGRVDLFGMQIDRVSMEQAVERVLDWCGQAPRDGCRYVVTPNVDHAVQFQRRGDLREAYTGASLVLADGAPIVLASKVLGCELPERVAGSDLVPRVFAAARKPLRVFLLGAADGVAKVAAARIEREWPNVRVVGVYSPPLGFENNRRENARIVAAISAVAPDLLVVGLGAPKQELWLHRHRHELNAKVALGVGATIDFLAGHRRRSPVWMRQMGLEWAHRVMSEPRRLTGRYARDAWIFPQLLWHEWRRSYT